MKQLLFFFIIFFSVNTFSQTPAFPCAYGGGAYATGGRGGNVYHVTNLLDDGSVGSFRWALSQPRPATIVFDVSGTILLQNTLTMGGSNLTIAGQTAPQGGITITCPPTGNIKFRLGTFGVEFENIIFRYVRIRDQFYGGGAFDLNPGYGTLPGFSTNPADYTFGRNLIFDHISISWAESQGFNIRGQDTHNITFQNGIIAECSRGSLFGDTDYESSYNNTFRNNVFYHVSHRTPNTSSTSVDVYNNVVYDWKQRLTTIKDGTYINHFNNYYYKGTRTTLFYSWNGVVDPQWYVNGITYTDPTAPTNLPIRIYSKNNVVQGFYDGTTQTNDQYLWIHHAGYEADGTPISTNDQQRIRPDSSLFVNTPFTYIGRIPNTFMTAVQTASIVPAEAGANKYLNADGTFGVFRDAPDDRYYNAIVNDTRGVYNPNGSTTVTNRHSIRDSSDYTNYISSISSTPINTRPGNFYLSNPHIPEIWFQANVPPGQNHNDTNANGYTWLEVYLNQVDTCGDNPVNNACVGKSTPVGTLLNSISGTYYKSDTINIGLNYNSDTTLLTVTYFLNGNSAGQIPPPFILDTTMLPQGVYSIYGVLTDACGKSSNTDTVTITVNGLLVNACNTTTPPTIDGVEETIWNNVSQHELAVTENGFPYPDTNTLKANYKIMWDATSLYVFVKVKDDTLVSDSPQLDFFRDDALSIFIDAIDDNSLTYDVNDYYIGMKQGSSDIIVNNVLYTGGGITKTDVVTSDGYNMEVKIDWVYLGLTPNTTNPIGLDFRVDDDDNGGSREHHLLWNDETSTLWNNPSKFGVLKLINTNCYNTTEVKVLVNNEVTIFPNPTNGEITIKSTNAISKIEIYNSLGALVLSKDKLNTKTQELSIANLPKGVYSIRMYELNRTIEKQIIKQ